MSKESSKSVNTGSGIFTSLLTVLFIGLKLTGYIEWSWVWVLSPLWIPLVLVLVIVVVALMLAAIFD